MFAFLTGAAVIAACGSDSGARRGDDSVAGVDRLEGGYLAARREARSCPSLRNAADLAFAQRNDAATLDAGELVFSFCPAADKLTAIEKTQVIVSRPEAKDVGLANRSVRLRLGLPLPPGHHLMWYAAYADRKLGLGNLSVGRHHIEVEMHFMGDVDGEPQMLRVAGATDVEIDGRTPVALDAVLSRGPSRKIPLDIALALGTPGPPAGTSPQQAAAGLSAFERRPQMGTSPARLPARLVRSGLPASIDVEICFDAQGRVIRADPLTWPHPRYLGAFLDGLAAWNIAEGGASHDPFCAIWRETIDPTLAQESRAP